MSLMGIDVGSSRCKAAVFSARGDVLGVASRAYGGAAKDGTAGSAASGMDPREFWHAAAAVAREAAAAAAAAGDPVRALALGEDHSVPAALMADVRAVLGA
jgi:xylulokinase